MADVVGRHLIWGSAWGTVGGMWDGKVSIRVPHPGCEF
jgi:hypothetical protein